MSDPNYDVTEVLWVIRSDRPGMIALQVQEVITKRTVRGEDIQYLVSTPNSDKSFLLHTVQGRIFKSIDKAKEALYKQATDAIDSVIDKVQAQASEAFGIPRQPTTAESALDFLQPMSTTEEPKTKQPKQNNLTPEEGYEIVEMDGKRVKIKLPDGI